MLHKLILLATAATVGQSIELQAEWERCWMYNGSYSSILDDCWNSKAGLQGGHWINCEIGATEGCSCYNCGPVAASLQRPLTKPSI